MEIKTDVCINFKNHPFITCWESLIPNLWYNDELEYSFMLTPSGFRICKGRSKTEYINWITQKEEFKLLFHDGWKDNPLSFDYDEYYKKQDDYMKNTIQQLKEHKQTPWAMPDDGKIYIGKSSETFELTFNEDFKPNTELKKELTSDELKKVIEEVIMNSNIPEWDREVKIYMGPKQREMFDKAFRQEVERQQLLYDTIKTNVTNKLNQEIAKQYQESDRGSI